MIVDYQSKKNEILKLTDTVEDLVKNIKQEEVELEKHKLPSFTGNIESLLKDMRSKVAKIREDRFTIIIAGEAKSGKSTFINAYLGIDLLPMDVKQCTSSIIEIKYGNKFSVKATYANGRVENILGEADAREFLKKNAALDDNYRDIPVPTINSEILIKSGLRSRKKGRPIHIQNHEVEAMLNSPEVMEANIHGLPNYNERIKEYIDKRKNSWETIVTKIEVFFPFEDEDLKGIEIIDSPGVCARGGVSEITSDYIENADAIIFLKPISGQALESKQFNQFMKNSSVKRNKNSLFLVLTRATNVTDSDLRRLEEEAYKQFQIVNKSNILIVDSKAELYVKQLDSVDNIEEELRRLNQIGMLDDFVSKAYMETSGILGSSDTLGFIEKLKEKSRFKGVYDGLNTLGRKAHYLLLMDLLKCLDEIYTKLSAEISTNINFLKKKIEDPISLSRKIADTKQELTRLQNKMSSGLDAVACRFVGYEGIIKSKADAEVEDFLNIVASIDPNSRDAFNRLEGASLDKVDQFKSLTKLLQHDVISEFDKALIALTNRNTIPFESLKPDFTAETFKEIQLSTEAKGYEVKTYTEGLFTFEETHEYSEYVQNKHFGIVKNSILQRLGKIKNDMIENLENFVDNIQTRYLKELVDSQHFFGQKF